MVVSLGRPTALLVALLALAACDQTTASTSSRPVVEAVPRPVTAAFGEAGDGTVIPDAKPDADSLAYASHCGGTSARAVAMGMSECDLIGLKGTPSRVVGGLDQQGRSHNAIWYIEGGVRTVYKFDDDKLADVIK
jgi:hypothetical protein